MNFAILKNVIFFIHVHIFTPVLFYAALFIDYCYFLCFDLTNMTSFDFYVDPLG